MGPTSGAGFGKRGRCSASAQVRELLLRAVARDEDKRPNAVDFEAAMQTVLQRAGGDPRQLISAPDYDKVADIEDRARQRADGPCYRPSSSSLPRSSEVDATAMAYRQA